MRRDVTLTLQLYDPVDETFVSLSFFLMFFETSSPKRRLLNFIMKKLAFLRFFFPENFLSEVEFFCRVVKM